MFGVVIEFVAKPGVAAASLALIWILESVLPLATDRSDRLRHDLRNLVLGIVNAVLASALFAGLTLSVTEWSTARGFGLLSRLDLPEIVTWTAAFVLVDGWQYWWHRLNHAWPLLWRFHAVHHADVDLDASSSVRFHTGEILASALVRLAILPLLGVTLPQLVLYELVAFPVIAFHHGNVRWPERWDRVARALVVTPGVHRVHHSADPRDFNRNFASVLTIWDRIFGSFRAARVSPDRGFGLHLADAEWRPLGATLAMPFHPPPPNASEAAEPDA